MKIKKQKMKCETHSPVYDKQTGGSKCKKCGVLLNDFNQEYPEVKESCNDSGGDSPLNTAHPPTSENWKAKFKEWYINTSGQNYMPFETLWEKISELLNSDMQTNGASQEKPNSKVEDGNQKEPLYRWVIIKSDKDLPKEDGIYLIKDSEHAYPKVEQMFYSSRSHTKWHFLNARGQKTENVIINKSHVTEWLCKVETPEQDELKKAYEIMRDKSEYWKARCELADKILMRQKELETIGFEWQEYLQLKQQPIK